MDLMKINQLMIGPSLSYCVSVARGAGLRGTIGARPLGACRALDQAHSMLRLVIPGAIRLTDRLPLSLIAR
jgi:hypothetical protein